MNAKASANDRFWNVEPTPRGFGIRRQLHENNMAPGPHRPGLQQLLALVCGRTDLQHQRRETVRMLRSDPPLLDFFLKQRQVARGITPTDGQPDVDRSWQQSVTDEERNQLVELIAHTIGAYPAPEPIRFFSGEPILLETSAFRAAGSRKEYYRLVGEDIRRVVHEKEMCEKGFYKIQP